MVELISDISWKRERGRRRFYARRDARKRRIGRGKRHAAGKKGERETESKKRIALSFPSPFILFFFRAALSCCSSRSFTRSPELFDPPRAPLLCRRCLLSARRRTKHLVFRLCVTQCLLADKPCLGSRNEEDEGRFDSCALDYWLVLSEPRAG